jgi:hypothetical protein
LTISVSVCLLNFVGCGVTPVTHDRTTIAYEGNQANGGIVGILPDGSYEITPNKLAEYDDLVELFGNKTIPETEKGFGVSILSNGNFSITKQGLERWYSLKLIKDRKRIDDSDRLLNL